MTRALALAALLSGAAFAQGIVPIGFGGTGGGAPGTSNVVADFSCDSFGDTAVDGGTLNITWGAPVYCTAITSTVSSTAVNGSGWVPEVWFEWDWDDASLGTRAIGGLTVDLGKSIGHTAVHAYRPSAFAETCNGGTNSLHTLTLTVYSLVSGVRESDSATMSICVENPATTWPNPIAYCDDADCSNDAFTGVVNAGTPTHGGNGTALNEILNDCASASNRILVEGGVTFSTSTTGNGLGANRCLIESYGTGKAKFQFTHTTAASGINANRGTDCDSGVSGTTFNEITFLGVGDVDTYLFTTGSGNGCIAVIASDVSATVGEEFGRVFSHGALTGAPLPERLFWFEFDVVGMVPTCPAAAGCEEPVWYIHCQMCGWKGGQLTGTTNSADRHLMRLPQWNGVVIDAMLFQDQGDAVPMLSLRQQCGGTSSCPEYAQDDTLVLSRTRMIAKADENPHVEICSSGSGSNEQTKCFDIDILRTLFSYEGTYGSGPKDAIQLSAGSTGRLRERIRLIQNGFDTSECNSSTRCRAMQDNGGVGDVAILGNVIVYAPATYNKTASITGLGATELDAVKNNVGVEVGSGFIDLFPSLSESADNVPATSDIFDRDGDAIAINENFAWAEIGITPSNTALKGQGVISTYPTDVLDGEAIPQSSDYDAGVDDE